MKKAIIILSFFLTPLLSIAQEYDFPKYDNKSFTAEEQPFADLSQKIWDLMAAKDADALKEIFHPDCEFVHMGGYWGTEQELQTIKSGMIWYKHAEVYGVDVKLVNKTTTTVYSTIVLDAQLGPQTTSHPFFVSQIFNKEKGKWRLVSFVFTTRVMGPGINYEDNDMKGIEVTEAIRNRRSIRHYTDEPVSREQLQDLAKLGIMAPNAMNKQEWALRIVDSKDYLDGVTELMKTDMPFFVNTDDPKFRNGFRNAPAVIMIAAPKDDNGMTDINVGLLCENICLAAEPMGLGTIVMGGPSVFIQSNPAAKKYLEELNLPEGYTLRICVGIGHPDEKPEAKPRDESKIQFVGE